jgi:hypothetical protein
MKLLGGLVKIKGAGYLLWQAKHMVFHVILGLAWVWFLGSRWHELRPAWLILAMVGSLLPDLDHIIYFLTYGKGDTYTKTVVTFFKNRQWRVLTTFLASNHKHNTSLTFHNYYTVLFCIGVGLVASARDWQAGVVLFGAMASHFLFDIAEDLLLLGRVNPNWKRWGRKKNSANL